jgi:Zn-dependent protease with chaperone function
MPGCAPIEANVFLTDSPAISVLPPVGALLLPIGLTLYIVRKAQYVSEEDRVTLWFSCVRFLRWLAIGTLLAWWVVTDLVHWKQRFLSFLNAHEVLSFPGANYLALVFFWLPPMLVVVICQTLFQPVYAGVRGITWTRAELARQMAYSLGASFLPLLFVTSGFSGIFGDDSFRSFAISFVLALVCAIFFGRRLRKLLQLSPDALTTGELRDRAFFLASQLRVKLQQIYLLPPSKSRLANAFARSGRSILLTHYLLSHLTRREVDAVVGHELAHLKHDHPRLLGFALMGGFAAVCLCYFFLSGQAQWKPLFDVLFVAIPLLTYYFVARRFEFTADATSIRATGDPEAMITGLVKLHRLNLLPLQWGRWNEKLLTHPSTVRRAQAIARVAQISEARVAQLLDQSAQPSSSSHYEGAGAASEYYTLPTPDSLKQKVFSTEFKQSLAARSYLLSFVIMVMLPVLLLMGVDSLGIFDWDLLVLAATLFSSAVVFLLFLNFLPLLGSKRLEGKMHLRAESEGVVPLDMLRRGDATLVGLSPGPAPRIFEGNYSWDAGYLYTCGDGLFYCGEETRFSLRRDQVVQVQLGPGMPGWFRARSLYIVWRDAESGSSAIFNLRPLAVGSVLKMNHAVRALAERIESWRTAQAPADLASASCQSLPLPEVRAVTGTSIRDACKPRQLFSLLILIGFLSGTFASLLGLPFDGALSLFWPEPNSAVPFASVLGWYAVLCSVVLFLLLIVPLLRARDVSISFANLPVANPPPPPPSMPSV